MYTEQFVKCTVGRGTPPAAEKDLCGKQEEVQYMVWIGCY